MPRRRNVARTPTAASSPTAANSPAVARSLATSMSPVPVTVPEDSSTAMATRPPRRVRRVSRRCRAGLADEASGRRGAGRRRRPPGRRRRRPGGRGSRRESAASPSGGGSCHDGGPALDGEACRGQRGPGEGRVFLDVFQPRDPVTVTEERDQGVGVTGTGAGPVVGDGVVAHRVVAVRVQADKERAVRPPGRLRRRRACGRRSVRGYAGAQVYPCAWWVLCVRRD